MSLTKNKIKKLLAAFLCACLLLTYNPVFGAIESAYADASSGTHLQPGTTQDELDAALTAGGSKNYTDDADEGFSDRQKPSTVIRARTYDSSLKTAQSDSFSATVTQLQAGRVNNNTVDISYIWYEVTGGTPRTNGDPYNVRWTVYENGEKNPAITGWVNTANNQAFTRTPNGNVENYKLYLQKIAQANLLQDKKKYVFEGTFSDSDGATASLRITLYTLPYGTVNFQPTTTPVEGKGDLKGVELEGMLQDPLPELKGGKLPDSSSVKEKMDEKAAEESLESEDKTYVAKDPLYIATDPENLNKEGEPVVPPFDEEDLIIRLPIDPDSLYEDGDDITVLWTPEGTDKVIVVKGKVVEELDDNGNPVLDENGKPIKKVELTSPFPGTDEGEEYPPLPGYFAVQYEADKLPGGNGSGSGDGETIGYFTITTEVIGNGTITPDGKKLWRAGMGTDSASALDKAAYAFAPMGSGDKSNELTGLTLECTSGNPAVKRYDLLSAGDRDVAGATLSTLKTSLTFSNSSTVFPSKSEWKLTATFSEFSESTLPNGADPKGTHSLKVTAQGNGKVAVAYYNDKQEMTVTPTSAGNVAPANSVTVDNLLNSAKATVIMVPDTATGKFYEVTKITMKVGSRAAEDQAIEKPLVIPATSENVEVEVTFEEFTETPDRGDIASYTVNASVVEADEELGSLVSEASFQYNENMPFIPNIVFEGATTDQYLSSVEVFVGNRTVPERLVVNADKRSRFELILPNYHANLRVVGYFSDVNEPTIRLNINVVTEGTAETPGGTYSMLGWSLPSSRLVASGKTYPLMITPNEGYALRSVVENVGGVERNLTDGVSGRVLKYMPIDDRTDQVEKLDVNLTITFMEWDSTGGLGEEEAAKRLSRVSMYVADESMGAEGSDYAYLLNPEADNFLVDGEKPADFNAAKSQLSVEGYSASHGFVNGNSPSLFDTVKYGGSYPLNLIGSPLEGEAKYSVQKLLVVKYYFGTDENGVSFKQPLTWDLYTTNIPAFTLDNITTHTDVIAYFAPVGDGENGTVADNGFLPKDYRLVVSSTTPDGKVTPEGETQVLRGSTLPLKFVVSDPEYKLADATVTMGGTELPIADDLTRAGTSNATYYLKNITANATVAATYAEKSDEEKTNYKVSADVWVKANAEADPAPLGTASMPCRIYVKSGQNYAQELRLLNGATNGQQLLEGTDLRFALTRADGYYKLNDLALVWDTEANPQLKAYIVKTTVDGASRNTIYFTTDEAAMVGHEPYVSGTSLYADGESPEDVHVEQSWFLNDLACNVTLKPTYEKLDRLSSGDQGDNWILSTKVGSGFGQVLVSTPGSSGSMTKVPKDSVTADNPLVVKFVPAPGYVVKDIRVNTSTGNPLRDFWVFVTGFLNMSGTNIQEQMKQEAINNGSITLQRMTTNYEIIVDFAIDPDKAAAGSGATLDDLVAVNVVYDSDKGIATPNTGLLVNRNAEQQFVVTPNSVVDENDGSKMFYSVSGVSISVGDDVPDVVMHVDENSSLVKWNADYPNVFVVDFAQLDWLEDKKDAAVTVEILFSDFPDTDPDESDPDRIPGTPKADEEEKHIIVNVVTEGQEDNAIVGNNGVGGIVSPRGEFSLVPPKEGSSAQDAYKQRVDVVPGDAYTLKRIVVISNGDELTGGWQALEYMTALETNPGYFEVLADAPGTEQITVYFELKPLTERSYTIKVEAKDTAHKGFVQPNGTISVENTKSQSYSIDPDLGFQVKKIDDFMVDEYGRDRPLPEGAVGAGYTREPGDEGAVNEFTVAPIRHNGKVIDRHVVVEFEAKEGVDHGLVKSDKVDLHVQAYGPGAEYLEFDPDGDMLGVFKGTATKPMSYTYNYSLTQDGIAAGYGIYRVQANGATIFGSPDNTTDMRQSGSYTFTTDSMRSDTTNNLYVYVKKNPATDPEGPGASDPNNPDNDASKFATVEYTFGTGGTVTDKSTASQAKSLNSRVAGESGGSFRIDPAEPFVLLITPDEGYVVDRIIRDNCWVLEQHWTEPSDSRTAKVTLETTMQIDEGAKIARVQVTFKRGNADTFVPWDATQDPNHVYEVNGQLVVKIGPADGVEALMTSGSGDMTAAGILDVSNPVAPFTPTSEKGSDQSFEFADDHYEVTYGTVSKLGDHKKLSIVVGPLIKWNKAEQEKSILYTVDGIEGLSDVSIKEVPQPGASKYDPDKETKPAYYTYYRITGTLNDVATQSAEGNEAEAAEAAEAAVGEAAVSERNVSDASGSATPSAQAADSSVVHIGLRGLTFDEGVFPDYMQLSSSNSNGSMVEVNVQILNGQGTVTPTTTTVAGSWFDGKTTGPWTVASGSTIAFKVEPANGYVLTGLSYNGISALGGSAYNADTGILSFKPSQATTVYASFATKDSAEALRTVTISVVGGTQYGTTYPAPGEHKVQKGMPYSITLQPIDGYVPYRIWVDGQESFVAPTLGGWMLPAWWHDQTFKVEFAPEGTTPGPGAYLQQGGYNLANDAAAALARTGDNPWLPMVVLLLLLAGGAAFVGGRMMRASDTAGRAAKYSVTRRDASSTRKEEEQDKE